MDPDKAYHNFSDTPYFIKYDGRETNVQRIDNFYEVAK